MLDAIATGTLRLHLPIRARLPIALSGKWLKRKLGLIDAIIQYYGFTRAILASAHHVTSFSFFLGFIDIQNFLAVCWIPIYLSYYISGELLRSLNQH